MKNVKHALLGSSSLTRPLLLLGAASAVLGAAPAYALDSNALPQGANVVGGSATVSQSGNTLNVNQSSNRAIINWRSFDIGSQATTNFAQPNSSSIAVNRVNGSANASQIEGTLHANGQVWILNPNGVLFGKTATVDAAGIVASTANIEDKAFMAGNNSLKMTGGDTGQVVNEGHISVGQNGLAAFVAPSVRNSGTIQATVGKIALAAGDTYTLDLAGDHLVEIGLGATKAVVDQSGKIVNPGGTIAITAQAAGQVVDSVINMSGVTDASSVKVAGGQITLGADNINTASSSQINANGGGNGGSITAVANKTGTYAGTFTAQGGAQGGNGGSIETSGQSVTVDPHALVSASAANGKAGTWTLDPLNVTITAGNNNGVLTGPTVTNKTIQQTIAAGTSVDITTAQSGTDAGDLTLSTNISAASTNGAGLTLEGRHLSATGGSTISISGGGALTLDVNTVNTATTTSAAWITDAMNMIGTVKGGSTINLGAATYTVAPGSYLLISPSNLTINGAGMATTTIDASGNNQAYSLRVWGDNVSLSNFSVLGSAASNGYGVKVEPSEAGTVTPDDRINNFSISNVTISGSHKNGLDLNGVKGATINDVTVKNTVAGTGIAVTDSANVTITNSTTTNNAWGGLALYEHNATYNQKVTGISVDGTNTFNEANPIYMENESGGTKFGTVSIAGYNFIAGDQSNANDIYTFFQKTAAAAESILDATGRAAAGYVEGWGGTAGTNVFNVDHTPGGTTMSIKAAVNAAGNGATINIGPGTFEQQVIIDNQNLTLSGAGAGSTIIESPDVLSSYNGNNAVVSIQDGANATIQNLTVNGLGKGNGATSFDGIGVYDSSATINKVDVTGLRDSTLSGAQHGMGVDVINSGPPAQSVTLTNSSIEDFQKNAAAFKGGNLTVDVENNTITGAGNTGLIAQNGIELFGISTDGNGNVKGTIAGNTITGVSYNDPNNTSASGILLWDANGTSVTNNTVTGANQGANEGSNGIYAYSSNNLTLTGNNVSDLGTGIYLDSGNGNATVSGGSVSGNQVGIYTDKNLSGLTVTGVAFSNNPVQFQGSKAAVAAVLADTTNTFDASVVNAAGDTSIYGDLQLAINTEAAGSTLDLGAGTYDEALDITKNVNLVGAGIGQTIIAPTALLDTGVGHKYDTDVQAAIFVNGANNVNISGVTIDANNANANAAVFWNNASGSISNSLIELSASSNLNGAQTGQDLAVDATAGNTSKLGVSDVTFQNWNKNAIDAVTGDGAGANGGNISLNVTNGSSFIGAGDTSAIAQNGIVLWEQGGGKVNATVDNASFTGLDYTGAGATAAGVLQYGSPNGTVSVTNSNFDNSVQTYISLAGGSSKDIDASTDSFDGVAASTASLDQLYAIENKIIDGTDALGNGLVRLQAGQVYVTAAKASEDDLQNAIAATAKNDTVNIQAGTYNSQIVVDHKDITLAGAGAGQTIITSPTTLASNYNGNSAVLSIQDGANVTVEGLTVDGQGNGAGTTSFDGIGVYDSSATINNVSVIGMNDGPLDGAQHGIGVDVINSGPPAQSVTLTNSSISGFQKNGAAFKGGNLTADVEDNTITGAGNTGLIAQNGIEMFGISTDGNGNVKGTIAGNTITGVSYNDPNNTSASGILLWDANGTSVTNNTVTGANQGANEGSNGIYAYSSNNLTLTGNNVSDLGTGIYLDSGNANATVSGGSVSGNQAGIYTDKALNNLSVTGVSFSDNLTHFQGSKAAVAAVLADTTNTFDKTVVNDAGDTAIYGDLQTAINNEANKSVLDLSGTFNEQVSITDSLTLNGSGQGTTIISAPATLGNSFTTQVGFAPGTGVDAVVSVTGGGNVTLENLTVDGQNNGNGNYYFAGIGVNDANVTVNNVHVTGISDNPLDGVQSGVGIGVFNDDGTHRTTTITGSTIDGFQKNGIALQGGNLSVDVENNIVTGAGNTAAIGQNGIELFGLPGEGNGLVTGTVAGNAITNVSYNGPSDYASSIYLIDTNNVTVSNNTLTGAGAANGSSYGISVLGSTNADISANTITGFQKGISVDDAIDGPYFASSGKVTVGNNLINGNGTAVDIGGDTTSTANVVASDNDLSGNTTFVDLNSSTATANFSGNYWGLVGGTAIEAKMAGTSAAAVDFSPFLLTGTNLAAPGAGFEGDYSDLAVTTQGGQTGSAGRIQEGLNLVTSPTGGGNGAVHVQSGTYLEDVKVTSPVDLSFSNAGVTVDSLTLQAGAAGSELAGNVTASGGGSVASDLINLRGAIDLSGNLTLDTSAVGGNITIAQVDGTSAGGQNLTLKAGSGSVSLGDAGATTALGALKDENATTLTGDTYEAASLDLGAVTLAGGTTNLDTSSDNGQIKVASVDDSHVDQDSIELNAGTGAILLGDVGDNKRIGGLTTDSNTTLTGNQYTADSISLSPVTLDHNTTITAPANGSGLGGIELESVDGSGAGGQNLTIKGNSNIVLLGDIGDSALLGAVKDDSNTLLFGTSYRAASIEFDRGVGLPLAGAVVMDTSANNGNITIGELLGVTGSNITLDAGSGTVFLGNVGDQPSSAPDSVTSNNNTVLTGSTYNAGAFSLGATTLVNDATIDTSAANGAVTIASVDGTTAGGQSLTVNTGTDTASLGNIGATTALNAVSAGGSVILTGGTYNANSIAFGALALDTDTTLNTSAGNGAVTVASVDGTTAGSQSLTINTGTGKASLGNLGATTRLGAFSDTGSATLTGGTYNANSLNLGALTLAANTTLNTSAANGAVTIASADGSTAGGQSLTINTGTGKASLGNLGATTRLGAVSDTGSATLTGGTYNANSLNLGALTLAANTTLNTSAANGAVTVASADGSTAGGQSLTINTGTGTASLGNLGATTRLGAVSDTGSATLTGGTYNANSLNLGALTLAANTTLNTSAANGAVTVASADGSTAGGQSLTINTGTGTASLGNLGATTRLGAFSDTGAATLTGATYNANSMNLGALTIGANATLDTSAANGAVTVASADGSTAGGQSLTVNTGTGKASLGNLGATTRLGAFSDTGSATLTGGTYNANSLNLGALTLAANTTLNTSAANGAVTIASADGSTAGGQSLTINTGTGKASLGNLGATTRLGAVSDTGSATLTGGTYNANSLNLGALTLAANTTLNTSAANGAVTVASADGSTAGGQSLTINTGTGTASLGNLGATTRLGAVSDTGSATLTGGTYNANSLSFGGNVTLTAPTTTLNTTQSSSAAGDITFNANILGTSNGGQNLVLIAGPGTGAASANGNMTLQNVGTSTLALNNLTVSGNNFTALTVNIAGNYNSTLTGNQVFASDTLDAGGNVVSNVAGNASGHIAARGTVSETVGGTISGTISGSSLTLASAAINGATLTGTNAIAVNTGLLSASFLTAPNVLIVANRVTDTTVTATNLNISASGDIEGTWQTVNANGSNGLLLNGQLATFNHLSPQQLVVEGFNLPAGTQIAANGALLLPAGVLIGLLAPGGGVPRVVLVQSVQGLGELLSEGYVAIVIDLNHRKKDDKMQLASNTN